MFKRLAITAVLLAMISSLNAQQPAAANTMLVIHGGAGTITRAGMTAEMERQYREALEQALLAGHAVLARGGSSLDAVEAAIRPMEDSPLFNAGKGGVFTDEGRVELDASIMDGRTKRAGAVAAVTIIRNPITAARAVMEKSPHVMLSGRGAELFASKMGLAIADPSYFWTERRWKSLQDELRKKQGGSAAGDALVDDRRFGTVGAVALDAAGNLAAGTSTGGKTGKLAGRIGDSPVIGAGNFAENESCAVSGTGDGEFFIRWTVAYDVAALMKYRGMTVQQAADEVIHRKLAPARGEAGVIALDARGNFAMPFNTEGMYRGWIGADGKPNVLIYKD
jgi:L-asparaginase / beta-aspartyl-peptidase